MQKRPVSLNQDSGRRITASPKHPCRTGAFTLIEMLVVIGLVFMLITLVTVGTSHLVQASRLAEAALMVENTLLLASQRAALEDREVEVRFYELPSDPGAPALYSAFQVFGYEIETDPAASAYSSPGAASFHPAPEALGPIQRLPSGVAVLASDDYSTLITHPSRTPTPATTEIEGAQRAMRRVRFLPSGGTDLSGALSWTLLLCDSSAARGMALPDNYAVLRMDPATARVTVFRPE